MYTTQTIYVCIYVYLNSCRTKPSVEAVVSVKRAVENSFARCLTSFPMSCYLNYFDENLSDLQVFVNMFKSTFGRPRAIIVNMRYCHGL